jgi:hypothetical protein
MQVLLCKPKNILLFRYKSKLIKLYPHKIKKSQR